MFETNFAKLAQGYWRFGAVPHAVPCKRALRGASCGAMKEMFGKDQLSAMADLVQGSLMLRYNKRCVG